MKHGRIHIGTSGWHYLHWVGPFYPATMRSEDFLSYYSRRFRTVEINNTFYRLPSLSTVAKWREITPPDFVFACKASRFITHMKKLKDPQQSLQQFFEVIHPLGPQLGPIVFQLPPHWHRNLDRLEAFLQALPATHRYAFEFRDESWLDGPTYDLLRKHHAALCLYHFAGRWSPEVVTAQFVYIRLHGPEGLYEGGYDDSTLRIWGKKMLTWAHAGIDVYCYFDNDQRAHAPRDAQRLQHIIQDFNQRVMV